MHTANKQNLDGEKTLERGYDHMSQLCMYLTTDMFNGYTYVWQSWIEIEYYSIAYLDCIAVLKVL